MKSRYLLGVCLIGIPALCTALLNMYASAVPFFAEITILVLAVCLLVIGYRSGLWAYRHQKNASRALRALYIGIVASIAIFLAAQLIRLVAGILYGLSFVTDPNALALQAYYVLPSFIGGTITGLPFIVGVSFAMGFLIILPAVYIRMRTASKHSLNTSL